MHRWGWCLGEEDKRSTKKGAKSSLRTKKLFKRCETWKGEKMERRRVIEKKRGKGACLNPKGGGDARLCLGVETGAC